MDASALYVTAVCILPKFASPSTWPMSTTVTSAITLEMTRAPRMRTVFFRARLPRLAVAGAAGSDMPSMVADMSERATRADALMARTRRRPPGHGA